MIRIWRRAMCVSSRRAHWSPRKMVSLRLLTLHMQRNNICAPVAWLLFEHGYDQAPAVRTLLSQLHYSDISTWQDWGGNERVTGGRVR